MGRRPTAEEIAHLGLEDKAAVLASLSDDDKAELLKELPTDEVTELFNLLERLEPGGVLTPELFSAMNYLQQAIILAVPPNNEEEDIFRGFLLSELPSSQSQKLQDFLAAEEYGELELNLRRWKQESPQAPNGSGARGHGWFTGMTTQQQALFLTFGDDAVTDIELDREELLESLSPEQVSLLHDFGFSAEAGVFINYLQQYVEEKREVGRERDTAAGSAPSNFKKSFESLTKDTKVRMKFENTKSVAQDVERKARMIEEASVASNKSQEKKKLGDPMKVLFDRFDTDGSGGLDEKEFVAACSLMGLNFPMTELVMMFREADDDGSGAIDVEEFTELIKQLRWKRMDMLTVGAWHNTTSEIQIGGLGMMHNWQEQVAWLDTQILNAQQLSRSDDVLAHVDADKMKHFRQRVRVLFDEVDLDANQALDMEELRMALVGFGLHFTDDMIREMFAFIDVDGSGEIDYNEFENAIIDLYFGRTEGGLRPEWQRKVMAQMESRLRPPPPARPKSMENRVGSVKAREECVVSELHGQQRGEKAWEQQRKTLEDNESTVTFEITSPNITSVRDRLHGKAQVPSFPSRPVVCLNVQEPVTQTWFAASFTNWLDGVVHPFQETMSLDYFESLREIELVAYDLEMAGDSESAQMFSGTAMIGVLSLWVPSSTNARARGKQLPKGSLHVQMIGGRRLPKADIFGLSDPFATLKCGKVKYTTHTELCTLDPEWGDEFEFQLTGDQTTIDIEVFDWDVESSDFLGMTKLNLESLCTKTKEMQPVETWYHLRKRDGSFVWGDVVADEELAARLKQEKTQSHARKAMATNIVGRMRASWDDYRNKFKKIRVRDARNMTASPDCYVGSIKVGHSQLMTALNQAKLRRIKAAAHRKAQGANLSMVALMLRGHVSTGECFMEWCDVVRREKSLQYFLLGNHPDKYASLQVSARDHVEGGEESVRIGLACKNLPKMDYFGKIDSFLVFEVQDPETKQAMYMFVLMCMVMYI